MQLKETIDLQRAALVCHLKHPLQKAAHGWIVSHPDHATKLGVLGGKVHNQALSVSLQGNNEPDGLLSGHLVFIPGSNTNALEQALQQEAQPLGTDAFDVRDGHYLGYDAARGFYRFKNVSGSSARHFTSFHRNLNMYLSTGIAVTNDTLDRKLYVRHIAEAGSIESAVLTDTTGFPLPVPIECAKNFGGEKEEPDDSSFKWHFPF